MAAKTLENTCLYNRFGYCKFKETCKYRHIKEKCQSRNCESENCLLRHPRECRNYRDYRRCKFGDFCLFSHDFSSVEVQVDQIEIVKNKLKVIEDKNVALNQIVDGQNESIKTLISAVDEKTLEIKNLELKVITLNESLENLVTSEQAQNQLLKATHFLIENAVQAVLATFEQKQIETQKNNETTLDALLEQ